ncbi:MAG TPA: endonuclease/exonuclease/phosphatase family protein [Tepidisphaeraceae bacterium]|nr:endonuclease/exonuclease/phosphatase family protein [Tepidisphaeraceae bacterium]
MSFVRRALGPIIRISAWLVLIALVAAAVGQLTRDHSPLLTLAFYLPLGLIGVALVLLDLSLRGRSLARRPRFAGTLTGLAAVAVQTFMLTGLPAPEPAPPDKPTVRLLQWNVRWGGGPHRARDGTWRAFTQTILSHRPDVVVLCESPEPDWLFDFLRAAGNDATPPADTHTNPALAAGALGDWHYVMRASRPDPTVTYRHRTVICSRWPVEFQSESDLPNGAAVVAVVRPPGQPPIRICAVDGVSLLHVPRAPLLRALADLLGRLHSAGRPVDIVTGDFNATSRAIGFDDVRAAGDTYRHAASHRAWAGTFPARLPLYDIDHVLINRRWHVADADTFAHPPADHRGQVYTLWRQ